MGAGTQLECFTLKVPLFKGRCTLKDVSPETHTLSDEFESLILPLAYTVCSVSRFSIMGDQIQSLTFGGVPKLTRAGFEGGVPQLK